MNRVNSIGCVLMFVSCWLFPRYALGQGDSTLSLATRSYVGDTLVITPEARYQNGKWVNLYKQQQKWDSHEIGADWHLVNADGASKCVVYGSEIEEGWFEYSPGWGYEWLGIIKENDTCDYNKQPGEQGIGWGVLMTSPTPWVMFRKIDPKDNPEDSIAVAIITQLSLEQISVTVDSLVTSVDSSRYGFLKNFSNSRDEIRYMLQTSHPLNGVMISYVFGLRHYYAPFSPPRSYESCNAISWGGYVIEENGEIEVSVDKATTPIPLAECYEDKSGLYYVPSLYFVIDDRRFIKADTHMFDADTPPMMLELKDYEAIAQYSIRQ